MQKAVAICYLPRLNNNPSHLFSFDSIIDFPAKNIEVGPSAPPIMDTATAAFDFQCIPMAASNIPITATIIANIFFITYPPHTYPNICTFSLVLSLYITHENTT